MRFVYLFGVAALVAAVDLWTKDLILAAFALHEGIHVTGFFNLVYVLNTGAAFGFLSDPSTPWASRLFLGATAFAAVVIFWIARSARKEARMLPIGLGLILGGALGNAVDRIRFGAVVDFLDFHYNGMHWPAFNAADVAICLGAGLTVLCILREPGAKA